MSARLLKILVASAVALVLAGSLPAADVRLQKNKDELRLSNGMVELVLDARSGYFRQIRNAAAGVDHKPAGEGVWPFGLWLGTRSEPKQRVAEIAADGVQTMRYSTRRGPGGEVALEVKYADLLENATRQPTGISLNETITMAPGQDYFTIRAALQNRGTGHVTNFYAGKGVVLANNDATLRSSNGPGKPAPTLGYAPYLIDGWFDYSSKAGGIGVGYVNPQGVKTVFDTSSTPGAVQVSWRTFDLKGMWHFEKLLPPELNVHIYPLEPGDSFPTGTWILAPHAGDWHRMADIYREHYEREFRGDYATWNDISPLAKQAHVQLCFWIAMEKQGPDGKWVSFPTNSFAEVVQQVRAVIAATGLRPANVSVMMNRQWEHGIRVPDYFPIREEAGGEAGLKKAVSQLKDEVGVSSVIYYVHPWYNHPDAQFYVKDAESGRTFGVGGNHYACQQNTAWASLWRDRLLPKFRAIRADGFYLDEGAMCWGICERSGPAHTHGTTSLGLLRENSVGSAMIHRLMREGLGPRGILMTEGGNDLEGRWLDIFQHFSAAEPRYTNPGRVYAIYYDDLTKRAALNEGVINGFLPQVNLFAKSPLTEEMLANLRHVAEVRQQLTDQRAPGYPQGFRDTVGLEISNRELMAKAFSGPEGITVTYYAPKAMEADITVNGAALGHPALGNVRRHVSVDPQRAGFFILRSRQE